MRWTKDKPTRPGYYWWRNTRDGGWYIVTVTAESRGFEAISPLSGRYMFVEHFGGEWSEVERPLEPEGGDAEG